MQWTPFSSATLTGPWTWPAGRSMSSSPLTRRSPRKWAGWPVAGSYRLRCLGGSHLGSPGSEHTPQPDIGHRGWLRKLGGADMMKITSLMRVFVLLCALVSVSAMSNCPRTSDTEQGGSGSAEPRDGKGYLVASLAEER